MRERIFEIIEVSRPGDKLSRFYDLIMMAAICISLIPLAFKETNRIFSALEIITTALFIADYLMRLATADKKLNKGLSSFLLYPLTPMAIIDLLCILPAFTPVYGGIRILKIFRLFRTLRVFRAFKAARYSKSVEIILSVIKDQKIPLLAVCSMAMAYILISALVVFNVEPETFETFFDAIYWATISLTTVGYGDIYPVTVFGRVVTMISSFVGIAIVALPAGIITAGYMDRLNQD